MGLTHIEIGVANPAQTDVEERIRVLVDTGVTLSVITGALLNKLGVSPMGRQNFRRFGGVVSREIGMIRIGYDRAVAGVTAVLGDEGAPPIMGVTALESLGYQVDPVTCTLVRAEMLLLRF